MSVRNPAARVALVVGGFVLFALVVGAILGQPIALSYVETGSMEPTIDAGDGFVPLPTELTGEPQAGDVIVYDAQETDGGGLTTHRVVEETDHGYVTRGDANMVTDQDSGEPHVTDGQVVAKAWEVNGHVVTIPHLGTAVMGVHSGLDSMQATVGGVLGTGPTLGASGASTILLILGVGAFALTAVIDRGGERTRSRKRSGRRSRRAVFDAKRVVLAMALVICLVSAGTMIAMSGPTEFGIVSGEHDSGAAHVIPMGESENQTYEIGHEGPVPVVTMVESSSSGVAVDEDPHRLSRGDAVNATVGVSAPDETGYYVRSFSEYRYFAVLPTPVIAGLHAIHPWVAMGAVTAVIAGVFVLPFAWILGTGTIRTRERRRTGRQTGWRQLLR